MSISRRKLLELATDVSMLLYYHGNDEDIRDIRKPVVVTRDCEKKKCKSCKHFRKDNYYNSMCELTYNRKSPLAVTCGDYIKRKK